MRAPHDGHPAGAEPLYQAVSIADKATSSAGRQPPHEPIVAPRTALSPGVPENTSGGHGGLTGATLFVRNHPANS
ncbi:hypothetical protein Adi01nite_55490 [Amorphoplanes digitatis]|nr:hypothetical protein GCM10020092_100680 [Actinoplanes digitatis]GID96137.1 hypothetical protein Adi01nite_55490 [Actinoplanes digitatis]